VILEAFEGRVYPGPRSYPAAIKATTRIVMALLASACGDGRATSPASSTADESCSYAEPGVAVMIGGDVATVQRDGCGFKRIVSASGRTVIRARWSPDGGRVAFIGATSAITGNDLFVVNADGTGETRLTATPGSEINFSWSPDGRSLLYGRFVDGTFKGDLFIRDVQTNVERRLTDTADENEQWAQLSPDGSRIVFTRLLEGIWTMNLEGGDQKRIRYGLSGTDGDCDLPWYSPNGQTIALICARQGEGLHYDLWLMAADGSNARMVVPDGRLSTEFTPWSPDGSSLLYMLGANEVGVYSVATGLKRQVTALAQDLLGWPEWAPDGQWIAYYGVSPGPVAGATAAVRVRSDGTGLSRITSGYHPTWKPR
jgi:Tol biopolymer transport system component